MESESLSGRVALVTGVSRPGGIGRAVADRLHAMGATVAGSGWSAHDDTMPWGSEPVDQDRYRVSEIDLSEPGAPGALIDQVFDSHGRLDIVVAVHARSSEQSLTELTEAELSASWTANVQSVLMLAQRFGTRHSPAEPDLAPLGRMIWFTSGQHLGPMESTLAYAVTKGALEQMTGSLNRALSANRIVANCINPGPVDTGWAPPEAHDQIRAMFPDKRWGTPSDVANLVAFLVGDQGAWIRGQVLNSEGGFNRYAD